MEVPQKHARVDALVKAISELREDGLDLSLYVGGHGRDLMNLPKWVHVSDYPWPGFVHYVLEKARAHRYMCSS